MATLINNSFIDYIIQNDRNFYNLIKPSLVDSETAVVGKLEEAKQKYPSIQILQELVPALGTREDGAQSIELKANVKDAYSENLYTGMMRELRDIPELNSLYNDIVNVAILQGIGQTAISIRNIIPVEDYAAKIKPIIDNLQPNIALKSYSNGMFQRNNFNNEDVFVKFIPHAHKPVPNEKTGEYDERSVITNTNTGEDELVYFLPSFGEMRGVTRTSRRLLVLNDMFNSFQLSSDYIKIPKVVTSKEGIKVNVYTGVEVTKADYAIMKKKGSQDLYDNYYYKKVYTDNIDQFGNRIPLRTPGINKKTGEPLNNYYYKLINVYGDGSRAVEYNTNFTPSVINNGSMKIEEETNDRDIVNFFAPQIQPEVVPLPTEKVTTSTSNKVVANVPQNKVSGVESYGSLAIANNEAIKILGPNPHSIDMIDAGLRTRTTRSDSEMKNYSVKVGDVIRNFGKSADGTTKTIDAVVTAIHPKGSPGWKGTWYKEGWRAEDVNVIDRFKDGAAAIEFEVVPLQEAPVVEEEVSFAESLENEATRLKQEIDNTRFDLEQLSDTMPEMIVANNFNKISPESARRETGANTGNKADISTSLLSNNGVSVEKAAENIWDDNFADNPVVDVQDVRNIIIDILSSGSIKNYKESILESSTTKELKEQYNAVQEKIKAGKETIKETKEKLKASQLSLFDKNAPEGLPEIDRSNEQCS